MQVQVDLTSPGQEFTQVFWVKIAEPQAEQAKPVHQVEEEEKVGLPQPIKVYAAAPEGDNRMTWETLANAGGPIMDYETVVHPLSEGEVLQTLYINMDSSVLKNYKSKLRSLEQHQVADRRYLSAVYFHTLFLYAINKQHGYQIVKSDKDAPAIDVDLPDYFRRPLLQQLRRLLPQFWHGRSARGAGIDFSIPSPAALSSCCLRALA